MSNMNSIKWKILTPMIIIFALMIAVVSLYSSHQQKTRLLDSTEQQLNQVLDNYLDGMNMLMLTGNMASRDTLRSKFESAENVREVRVLRGDAVKQLYGAGFDNEKPLDDMDRRALAGESLAFMENIDGERRLTVIEPYIAVPNRNGTDCLSCHQVEAGTVLGAGRITYSMANKDAEIEMDVWRSFVVNLLVVIAGLVCIYWLMYRTVIKPLAKLEKTMTHIGDSSDLRVRVELERNDEFLNVETAINKMLARFQPTIRDLTQTMDELALSSGELATITRETRDGMTEQQKESGELAEAIDELARAAEKVTQSAINAEEVAASARKNAEYGNDVVAEVAASINELAKGVGDAVRVVKELASDTQNIGKVSQSINEIAEQTNLLALNAAIEAARAGEQGRGFAVVADEVRSLATRTQESTKEINSIIERLVSVSEQAVSVMDASKLRADQSVTDAGRAGEALQQIASGVEDIREMNGMIAAAATEQNKVVERINKNIHAIGEVSSQTLKGSSRTLEQSDDLIRVVERLGSSVNKFKS